jgi:hypothetical protein
MGTRQPEGDVVGPAEQATEHGHLFGHECLLDRRLRGSQGIEEPLSRQRRTGGTVARVARCLVVYSNAVRVGAFKRVSIDARSPRSRPCTSSLAVSSS